MEKDKLNKIIKYIIINAIVLIIIYLFFVSEIRICLLYNLFKIPCSGCGLTRSIIYFIKGDIIESVKYNLLGIPITIMYIVCGILYFKDIVRNEKKLESFIKRNNKIILIIFIIIFILNTIRNINNYLLY